MTKLKSMFVDYKKKGWIRRSMAQCLSPLWCKIPKDLRLILSRQFCGDNWNLDELLKAFKTELDARLRVWEYQAVLIKYTHHYQNGREKKVLEIQQRQLWRH